MPRERQVGRPLGEARTKQQYQAQCAPTPRRARAWPSVLTLPPFAGERKVLLRPCCLRQGRFSVGDVGLRGRRVFYAFSRKEVFSRIELDTGVILAPDGGAVDPGRCGLGTH